MALSVRSARCASRMIIFFGFLFTSLASTFVGIHVSRLTYEMKLKKQQLLWMVLAWKYWLFAGYPILIGSWISLFFIFLLILLGTESYAFNDIISDYLPEAIKNRNTLFYCASTRLWWANCHLNLAVNICLLILAAFIKLLSLWCVICCCASLCCSNQVGPDSDSESNEGQQVAGQPNATQGTMMQGAVPVMVPMMYNNSLPVVPYNQFPTMQGNMQAIPMMQMTPGTYPPMAGVPVFANAAVYQ